MGCSYSGLLQGSLCFCSDTLANLNSDTCDVACAGDLADSCGGSGDNAISVYTVVPLVKDLEAAARTGA